MKFKIKELLASRRIRENKAVGIGGWDGKSMWLPKVIATALLEKEAAAWQPLSNLREFKKQVRNIRV